MRAVYLPSVNSAPRIPAVEGGRPAEPAGAQVYTDLGVETASRTAIRTPEEGVIIKRLN